jgi:hypothetical protein
MYFLELSLAIQLSLTFGLAGLFWPEKLIEVFDVLMFPWPATHKLVRTNAWGALGLSVLLLLRLLARW